ncbi:histidine kinase [Embleya sp. NBC_00888]|uniref:sensor histidine kinase n=1 Tax=Embleya sp. NBC_00888 TaxID=2975960 RepID=UPI00386BBA65|nr:histidine kinase [Embleya sp. NBC_00888]
MTFRPVAASGPRPFPSWSPARRSRAFDVTLALSVGLLGSVLGFVQHLRDSDGDFADTGAWLSFAAGLIAGLVLVVRRRHPVWCAAIVAITLLREQALAAFFAAYAVAVYMSDRRRMWAAVGLLCLATWQPWNWRDLGNGTANTLAILTPACYGLYIASRRRLVAALGERAERAEREQELRAEQAREEERNRLAGDMHDIVTHRVSLMVLQAGAMRSRAPDEATRAAAEDLRSTGCQALAELRDLVAVLRTGERCDAGAPVEPAVLDLSALVAESLAAGVEVRLHVEGTVRTASPVVVRTAYRVVQESLTNVHKHAPGAVVRVLVRHAPDELRITVSNTAATRPREIELGSGGTGLVGLQRRIELTGGTFRAGPRPDGGFELDARLSVASTASDRAHKVLTAREAHEAPEPTKPVRPAASSPSERPTAPTRPIRARPTRAGADRSRRPAPDRSEPDPKTAPGVLTASHPETG